MRLFLESYGEESGGLLAMICYKELRAPNNNNADYGSQAHGSSAEETDAISGVKFVNGINKHAGNHNQDDA